MKLRTLILLLLVATLTSMAATVSPRAARLNVQPVATTIPMLSGTTQAALNSARVVIIPPALAPLFDD